MMCDVFSEILDPDRWYLE